MRITMVKKVLLDGSPCDKCQKAEDYLRQRGLWERIDEVVVALEADPSSVGMQLAARHGVELAPFFIVKDAEGERVYQSVIELVRERLAPARSSARESENDASPADEALVDSLNGRFAEADPEAVIKYTLQRYGENATIAFSGAEDVAVIDMAAKSGERFSVFTLDTGRLHPETYRFLEKVRTHYGIAIDLVFPERVAVEALVRKKGLYSFYADGHGECCGIRKVEPLGRALGGRRAWISGQRRDQSPTRSLLERFELDRGHADAEGPLLKSNPLAHWSLAQTWQYLREQGAPTNDLHVRGFISIGCEPCTREIRPGEHERAGRWWWEEATKRECGLHTGVRKVGPGAGI
ncbi:MAG TPA: phosphoadenylyl-sulfate reductase [Polyangiaceae bacterium]